MDDLKSEKWQPGVGSILFTASAALIATLYITSDIPEKEAEASRPIKESVEKTNEKNSGLKIPDVDVLH